MTESLFDIWPDFGFRANPYSQETLNADDAGDKLLIGRDEESRKIQRLIGTSGAFPTVEGPIGVGKSSLLEVSAYRMRQKCLAAARGELYLPGVMRLQPKNDADDFEFEAYRVIAQTLIRYADDFDRAGLFKPDTDELNRWLNASMFKQREGGFQTPLGGVNFGGGASPNTSDGYARSGFPQAIRDLLESAFKGQRGGVVLVLDNLELIGTVGQARVSLEQLRDTVFALPNVRWILSGSRGIVSRARSERLSAIFQAPTVLLPLGDDAAIEAIRARIHHFGDEGANPPVTPEGFANLYKSLNSNLREALSTAQQFAMWIHDEYVIAGRDVPSASDLDALLEAWLFDRAERAVADAGRVQARNWQFFEELCAAGGRAGSSETEKFGFNKQQQLVSAVTQLSEANLVSRESDPDDGTKTVNSTTPLGWLVYFFRSRFTFPAPRA